MNAAALAHQRTLLGTLAANTAEALAEDERVVAVCLLGSVARGDVHEASDVDLLVLVNTLSTNASLVAALPQRLRSERLALIPRDAETWRQRASEGDLFAVHIALEGRPLYDPHGILAESAGAAGEADLDTDKDLRRQVQRLRLYRNIGRLNGNHLFALADLYGIGKAVAIARSAEWGTPIFVKDAALTTVAERRPDLAEAVETIRELRAFYDLAADREPPALPFDYHHAEDKVEAAVDAIQRLAHG